MVFRVLRAARTSSLARALPVALSVLSSVLSSMPSLVLGGCGGCAPAASFAGVDVRVDEDADQLVVTQAGRALLTLPASGFAVAHGEPVYVMEFGMFDIQDGPVAPTPGASLALVSQTEDELRMRIDDAAGNPLVDASLRAARGGLELVLVARTGDVARPNNRVLLTDAACPFRHAIGLGGQSFDVDHVGQIVPLWVSEQGIGKSDTDELPTLWQLLGRRHTTHTPMPAFVADNGAGYVVDVDSFVRLDMCSASGGGRFGVEVWDPTAIVRIYVGDTAGDVRGAQARMVDALGRPPLLPPWALHPWNDAIFGEDNVRAVAQRLRELRIPSSVIWTEDWRGGQAGGDLYRLDEDWDVDPALYPDFAGMTADLDAQGFAELVYFNTFLTQGADIFDEATTDGYAVRDTDGAPLLFTGADRDFSPTGLLDLTNDAALAFLRAHLDGALDLGVRGWMADFAEWMPVDGASLASGEDPALVHNRYPVLWQQANRDALEARGVLDDSVVFVRSGWLGSQSLAQVVWAGDQRTSFDVDDGLPTVVPMGIGLSAVGFPFFTHDIAGYQSSTNPPGDKELFFRWTELGAFSSVMRTHHGTHASLNYNLFTDDDATAHWQRYATLHAQLYPYLRGLAIDATEAGGLPLWVPLPLLFPKDDEGWSIKDEVLLGPALLVAPVLTAGEVGRDVFFPSTRFAPLALAGLPAGDAIVGPTTAHVDAALGDIPVFVRAGGIVPLTAEPADTMLAEVAGLRGPSSVEGDRIVVVGLGADGAFTEESGASYALRGTGTSLPASDEPDGAVVVTGDGEVRGAGFVLTLRGQPSTRTTRVLFR